MYETEKYIYEIHRQLIELQASVSALMGVLVAQSTVDLNTFTKTKESCLKNKRFSDALSTINEQLTQIDKWESCEDDGLGDIFASFFDKN